MSVNNKRQPVKYFVLTFAISWLLWLLPFLKNTLMPDLPDIVGLPGMFAPFGPGIAAFWLTWRESGKEGVHALWESLVRLNFEKKWLIPTLLLPAITAFISIALIQLFGGSIPWEYSLAPAIIVPVFLQITFTQAIPEEFGWRGYVLDPLQDRYGAVPASLILGAMWALWHLPLFFMEGTVQQAIPAYQFILQTMVLAILYTWLHNHTGRSVFIAALYHAAGNITSALIPFWITNQGRLLQFGVLVVTATLIIWRFGWHLGYKQRETEDAVYPRAD